RSSTVQTRLAVLHYVISIVVRRCGHRYIRYQAGVNRWNARRGLPGRLREVYACSTATRGQLASDVGIVPRGLRDVGEREWARRIAPVGARAFIEFGSTDTRDFRQARREHHGKSVCRYGCPWVTGSCAGIARRSSPCDPHGITLLCQSLEP